MAGAFFSKIGKLVSRFLAEIAIIFIGITLSFSFNEWRQNRDDRATEIKTLKLIKSDIQRKVKEAEEDSSGFRGSLLRLDSLSDYCNGTYDFSPTHVFSLMYPVFYSVNSFEDNTPILSKLTDNYSLRTVQNDSLTLQVVEFIQYKMHGTSTGYASLDRNMETFRSQVEDKIPFAKGKNGYYFDLPERDLKRTLLPRLIVLKLLIINCIYNDKDIHLAGANLITKIDHELAVKESKRN